MVIHYVVYGQQNHDATHFLFHHDYISEIGMFLMQCRACTPCQQLWTTTTKTENVAMYGMLQGILMVYKNKLLRSVIYWFGAINTWSKDAHTNQASSFSPESFRVPTRILLPTPLSCFV